MGRMKNGATFMKYILIVFNPVVMIYSLLLIGVGVAFSFKWSKLIELLPMGDSWIRSMQSWTPWMIFFVGLIMLLICILGCYCAFNENYWALVVYAIILFGVVILQVILGVLVYFGIVQFGAVEPMPVVINYHIKVSWPQKISPENAPEEVYSAFYDELQTDELLFKPVLEVQEKWKCCGLLGKSDYSLDGKSLLMLAKSCCPAEVEKCTPNEAYDDGCLSKAPLYMSYLKLRRIIQGVATGFVCLQVMLAVSALYLAKGARQM